MKRKIALIIAATVFLFLTSFAFAEEKQFLTVTDLHFNPYATCSSTVTPCVTLEKLNQAPAKQWESILAMDDTQFPAYKQDTNYLLLKSALTALNKTAVEKNISTVLVLGDYLSHDFRKNYELYANDKTPEAYQAFVKKTLTFLSLEIAKTFPTEDVYMTVGNNDSYQDDYIMQPKGDFFNDMATTWSALIKNKKNKHRMQHKFSVGGYYAVNLPAHVRLIVLNSVLFSQKTKDVDEAARDELTWLQHQLSVAHRHNKKVLIALHVPVGIDVFASLRNNPYAVTTLWKPEYASLFLAELQQYAGDVMAILPGHFHMDLFQIINGEIPVSFTPAISPLFGNNPAFKVFTYDRNTILNSATWAYGMTTQQWSEEYQFNTVYHASRLIDGMSLLQAQGDAANNYVNYFSVGTASQPITTKWLPYYWCNVHAITPEEYGSCVGS